MAEEFDILKACRLLAFHAVDQKPADYIYRYIMRWYSREFSTPLCQVEAMPIEDVLTHYFECRYEHMDEEELEEESEDLRLTAAEKKLKEAAEERARLEDDEFLRQAKEEAAHSVTSLEQRPDPSDAPIIPVPVMGSNLPSTFQEAAKTSEIKNLPQDINIEFADPDGASDWEDWDLMGPPAKDEPK